MIKNPDEIRLINVIPNMFHMSKRNHRQSQMTNETLGKIFATDQGMIIYWYVYICTFFLIYDKLLKIKKKEKIEHSVERIQRKIFTNGL